jgi:Type VI secretion system/phage-baseplate injector OB domain
VSTYFGKYGGTVANNIDPLMEGRIQVSVPAVLGSGQLSWAKPCVPYAGSGVGFFAIPPVGANVWVEFEAGDTDHPIWTGCFWGTGECPASPAVPQMKVLFTDSVKLTLSDLPGAGGFTLEVSPPAVAVPVKLKLDSSGIEISTGSAKVKLTPASVSINDGALQVI